MKDFQEINHWESNGWLPHWKYWVLSSHYAKVEPNLFDSFSLSFNYTKKRHHSHNSKVMSSKIIEKMTSKEFKLPDDIIATN